MFKNNLYIHIGPPKTATTAFQKFFINNSIVGLQYGGIVQPRLSDDDTLCKILYRASCGREILDYQIIDSLEENTLCSEEMFLVESTILSWQAKIKRLFELTSEQNPKIIIVLRDPISAIRSYYQELYFSLDKKTIPTINEFAKSNYCKIYDYDYLISFLKEVGFTDLILLDFKLLVNGDYKISDILDIDCKNRIVLERINKSLKKSDTYYANNPSIKKLISNILPISIKENKILLSILRLISYLIPDLNTSKSKKVDIDIDHEIVNSFSDSYHKVRADIFQ